VQFEVVKSSTSDGDVQQNSEDELEHLDGQGHAVCSPAEGVGVEKQATSTSGTSAPTAAAGAVAA